MKLINKTFVVILMLQILIGGTFVFSQTTATNNQSNVNTVQPSIMVVPWSSIGEDIRTKIEKDFNYRTAITKISNAFSDRGFSTKDFVTQLQNTLNDQTISQEKMNQTDLFKKVIELSPTDYYIETEVYFVPHSDGTTKAKILLTAIDKFTGDKIAAEPMSSPPFKTDDLAKLAEKALEDEGKLEKFFQLLNSEFTKIREVGRTITIKIELESNTKHKLDEEIGDNYDLLSDVIIKWVKANSYKQYAKIKGNSTNLLYFDDVKIPLRDDEGNNYDINKFATSMYKFLRQTGKITTLGNISLQKDIKGNNLYFKIAD
jgi:hypothetical protein